MTPPLKLAYESCESLHSFSVDFELDALTTFERCKSILLYFFIDNHNKDVCALDIAGKFSVRSIALTILGSKEEKLSGQQVLLHLLKQWLPAAQLYPSMNDSMPNYFNC
ncbi:unnamed protein product [Ilex paraguariensis]|uniref:Uncharacterized protein n=1 Tax=Ilex paraguariensis TaxID=185542 RepID=A0ABC8S4X3_9AQUA